MKKYILMLAAALGLAASCQKQEMVYFDPEKVVAPVLDSISSVLIDTENIESGKATFKWTHAYFGIETQIYYSIEAFRDGSDTTVLASNISGTKADISFSAMNSKLLFDLELAAGMPEDVNFILAAKLNKGDKYYSEPLAAKVTVVEVDKTYPGVYVLGEFNGWSHDKAQFLFDFAEEGKFYQGVVGFGSKAADGFKITGAASWEDATGNWGMSAEASAEPESITLANGSASNINCWSKSFYHFSFEKESLTLKKSKGFNSVSAVLNGTAMPMSFNAQTQKFFVDAEVAAGSTILFRFDDGTELGGVINDLKTGGSAIKYSTAGNYRIVLNMNNWSAISAVFDKGSYGEGTGDDGSDDPDGTSAWGIVGDFNSWSNDIAMTAEEGHYVAKAVEIAEGEKFKFRKDGKWASDGGDERTSASNPVKADMEYAAVEGYDGILVETAGVYDIYLTTALDKFYVMTEGKSPADAEKAPEPETVTVTVYSDNADLGYLYGWWNNEGSAHFTASWPGTASAGNETIEGVTYRKFTFEVDKTLFDTTKVKLILNDGKSEGAVQTDDSAPLTLAETMFITVADNKVTVVGAPEESEPETETVAVTFYCDNAAYTHIYGWWNIESSENWIGSAWPGDASVGKETVEEVEYTKWVVNVNKELFDAQTTVQMMFSDGTDANKTEGSEKITLTDKVFLTIKNGKPVLKGEESDEPETPETVAVTFYCDNAAYTHIYGWWNIESSENWIGSAWPGDVTVGKETVEEVEYAKWIVNVNKELFDAQTTVQMMFSDGTDANKTEGSEKITLTDKVFLTIKNGKPALKGEEGDEPETPVTDAWGIIGLGNDWNNDKVMTLEGDYWVAQDVAIAADDIFKFRTVGKWHQDGGDERTFAGGTAAIDIEYTAEYLEGEYNIAVAAAGTYDVYLTAALDKFYIMTDGKTPDQAGKEDDLKTFKVTVYGKDCYDHLYGWSADTGVNIFGAWPGTQGTAVSETINGVTYTMKWEVNVTEEIYKEGGRFIMNNGSDSQTGDSSFMSFGDNVLLTQKKDSNGDYLVWDNRPADDATTEVSVYCQSDKYSYLYGWWSDGTLISDGWPGNTTTTTETLNGKTYRKWTFTVSSSRLSYDKAKFILNNGNGGAGNQTNDSDYIKITAQTIITAPADKTE